MESNDEAKSISTIHPPTLRRLSRCVLIIASGLYRMGSKIKWNHNFWSLFQWLRTVADSESSKNDRSCTGILYGNAIELMAYTISSYEPSNSTFDYNALGTEFCTAVQEAADPNLSWIIRLSAATSIHVSGLLCSSNIDNEIYQSLFAVALELLQDSDEDVRKAVVKTLSNVNGKEGRFEISTIPILSLENSFHLHSKNRPLQRRSLELNK